MASSGHPQLNWQPEPESRGTFNIISTCLATLLFCTWTAVHTDIPENKRGRSVAKVALLVLGIIVPELALYFALRQLAVARQLADAGKKFLLRRSCVHEELDIVCMQSGPVNVSEQTTPLARASDPPVNSPGFSRKNEIRTWTLVHSFYVVMGGFAIDLPANKPFLPGFRERAILTPEGLIWLMEHEPDLIPPLTEETIMDSSKANAFSKFVSLSQVLWFCANCITRILQSLPLSLLEITTLAHALCTVATYLCWWHKPLNINEPTLIVGERALEICALMHMSGNTSADPKTSWAERNYIEVEKTEDSSAQEKVDELNVHHRLEFPSSTIQLPLQLGMVLKGTTFSPTSMYPKSTLNEVDVNRWRLASAAYSRYKDSGAGMPISVDNAYVVPRCDLSSFVKTADDPDCDKSHRICIPVFDNKFPNLCRCTLGIGEKVHPVADVGLFHVVGLVSRGRKL
ncbi:hypothetical protein EIP86_006109 [Pleurotus ostreatoroseus]|nr:hypothetical protein EIP86_006109 [Pleurotus ostreatoroseus]